MAGEPEEAHPGGGVGGVVWRRVERPLIDQVDDVAARPFGQTRHQPLDQRHGSPEVQVEVADVAVDAGADGEHGVEDPSTPPVPVPAPA